MPALYSDSSVQNDRQRLGNAFRKSEIHDLVILSKVGLYGLLGLPYYKLHTPNSIEFETRCTRFDSFGLP